MMCIGVAFISHITYERGIRKKTFYNKMTTTIIFCIFIIGAALKVKNLLPKFFPFGVVPILVVILDRLFKMFLTLVCVRKSKFLLHH